MDINTVASWCTVLGFGGGLVWTAAVWIRKMLKDERLELPTLNPSRTVIILLLVSGLSVSSISLYFSYRPRTITKTLTVHVPTAQILEGWGGPPGICHQLLRLDSLLQYQGQYNVAAICGLEDPTVDKFEDQRITVSAPRTIISGEIEVATPLSASMVAFSKQLNTVGVKEARIWNEIVLLPKNTSASDIRKLSDVHRYGGKVLSQDTF